MGTQNSRAQRVYATTTKRDERVLLENVRAIPILLGALLIFARRARRLEGRVAVDAGDADAEKNGGRHRSEKEMGKARVKPKRETGESENARENERQSHRHRRRG